MNIILLGGAGFIGTNLTLGLASDLRSSITLVDSDRSYFSHIEAMGLPNVRFAVSPLDNETDFENLLCGQQVVYHLVSTTVPTTSNRQISQELTANAVMTAKLLDACVACNIEKVVFISSGGTVYGREGSCPLSEDMPTLPISSYGIQKVTIEKLLYLYRYLHGLDYRVIRLANPYGPYQRPNGILGAVTTFTYRALKNEEIIVYGDGSVVRDFIFIDDAVKGIFNIVSGTGRHRLYNLGCGYGTSIREVLGCIEETLGIRLNITYKPQRKVDVPVNFLDISRYEDEYGKLMPVTLSEGIRRTADFLLSCCDI